MSSLPIEGTISAKPFGNCASGSLNGSLEGPSRGTLRGNASQIVGSPPDGTESAESSAIAELGTLLSSLGSLAAQAQTLPLSAPSLPGLPQSGYQPKATDYMQLSDDSN